MFTDQISAKVAILRQKAKKDTERTILTQMIHTKRQIAPRSNKLRWAEDQEAAEERKAR